MTSLLGRKKKRVEARSVSRSQWECLLSARGRNRGSVADAARIAWSLWHPSWPDIVQEIGAGVSAASGGEDEQE